MKDNLGKKLDARTRHSLSKGDLKGAVEVLIRLRRPPSAEEEAQLYQAGYRQRSLTGTISSGTIDDATQLESILQLPFVSRIEVSRTTFTE
jgi:hypothetical protein